MTLKKNDFAELEFIGIVKETSEVFDTTIEEEAKKAGLYNEQEKARFVPLKVCIGLGMVVKGFDNYLEGKEINKDYEIELNPEEAFGKRDGKLVRTMSVSAFRQRGVDPVPGMMLALDSFLVKISSVSGGRAIVDFNNPLSGKHIIYKFKVTKKIEDINEKIKLLSKFLIGTECTVFNENNKTFLEFDFKLPPKIEEEFKKKITSILGIEVEIREAEKKKEESKS